MRSAHDLKIQSTADSNAPQNPIQSVDQDANRSKYHQWNDGVGEEEHPSTGPPHQLPQLPILPHQRGRLPRRVVTSPWPNEAELGREIRAHGPGEEYLAAKLPQHVRPGGCGSHVERQLVDIALLVDAALRGGEVVVLVAALKLVVHLVSIHCIAGAAGSFEAG